MPATTTTRTRTTRKGLGLLLLLAALLAPLDTPTASAGEGFEALKAHDAEHQVVSDEVLELMGLDVDHTLVLGARLPALGSGRIREALSPRELKDTLMDILRQNAEELLMPFERDGLLTRVNPHGPMGENSLNVPSALALAVTLGDRDVAEAWHPLGIEWLGLDEITVVFAFEAGSPWIDGGRNWKLERQRDAGAGVDNGGVKIALAGSVYVRRTRFTCAIMVDKEIDFVGRVRAKATNKYNENKYADVPETHATTGGQRSHRPAERPTMGPQTRAESEKAGSAKSADTDRGIRTDPSAPALPPKSNPGADSGMVAPGTQAKSNKPEAKKHADEDIHLTLALLTESMGPRSIADLVSLVGADCPLPDVVENNVFVLGSAMAVLEFDLEKIRRPRELVSGFSLLGRLELGSTWEHGLAGQALLSVRRTVRPVSTRSSAGRSARTGPWIAYVGVRLEETSLNDIAPGNDFPLLGEVSLPSIAFVYARGETSMRSSDMNPAEVAFFDDVKRPYGSAVDTAYTLNLTNGVNFMGPLPMAFLPRRILNAVGIGMDAQAGKPASSADPRGTSAADTRGSGAADGERAPYVIVEGNPGIGLGLSRGMPRFSDMNLRITLPPISPERAPKVFVKGELYIELTGRPSLSLGGAITLDIQGDHIEFFLEGAMARTGTGFSVSLTGGMVAEQPWVAPFGIDWLTLNEVIAKISIDTTGSLGVGFSADMMIGSKVVDTTVYHAINLASGVPTNFIFEGRTNELALADIAALQQKMAKAAGRPAKLPIDALPNVALRDLYLRFAPMDEPDLGVEAGFGLAGSLWIETGSGRMERVAEVDVLLSKDGIELYGFVKGYALGPVTWDDAKIDLALTPERQAFSIQGRATVLNKQLHLNVNLTPGGMLKDFMAAHGDALKAGLGAAKDAAKAAVQAVKKKLPALRGRLKKRPLVRRLFGR